MYNPYKFKYNDPYYNEIISKRVDLYLLREKAIRTPCMYRFISDKYSKKEILFDFIRLSFIIGEPFIGRFGIENII